LLLPSSTFFLFFTRPPPRLPLFPYTTLFRSRVVSGNCLPLRPDSACAAAVTWLWVIPPRPLPRAKGACLPLPPAWPAGKAAGRRSEEHTSELQSLTNLVCRLLLEKKNTDPTH